MAASKLRGWMALAVATLALATGLVVYSRRRPALGPPPTVAWAKRFGQSGDNTQALAVAVDRAGNLAVAGWFLGTVDLGGGPVTSHGGADIFLALYTSSGRHVWSKVFGGSEDDSANAVAIDGGGNVYLAGDFRAEAGFDGQRLRSAGESDLVVAKYAPDGAHLWSKRFGGPGEEHTQALSVDSVGNLLLTGTFFSTVEVDGTALTSAGENDILLAKLSPTGDVLWAKRYGGAGVDMLGAVARGPHDEIVLAGEFDGVTALGGAHLSAVAHRDVFVARYTSDAEHVWSKRFGTAGLNHALAVAVDAAGGVLLTGTFDQGLDFGPGSLIAIGSSDAFIVKLSDRGLPIWVKRFGGTSSRPWRSMPGTYPADSSGNALIVAPGGDVVCVGAFAGSGQLEGMQIDAAGPSAEEAFEDLVLAAYSGRGEPRWVLHFGSGSHTPVAAVRDPMGALLVVGHFQGALGDMFLPLSRGGGFVMKLVPR
jgi:hypothetical protein